MWCVCIIWARGRAIVLLALFICTHQVTLVTLQEFLSYMESHRQRGHSMFENMRTSHLQVWHKCYHGHTEKDVIKNCTCSNLYVCLMYFLYPGSFSVLQLQATEWERVSSNWLHVEAELLRERAVFGPGPGVLLSRDWVQDAAEGPNRTRSRIRRRTLKRSKRVMPFSLELNLRSRVLFSLQLVCSLTFNSAICCYNRCKEHFVWV